MLDSSLNGKPEKLWVFDILKSLSRGWELRKGLCGRLAPMKLGLKHLFIKKKITSLINDPIFH